MFFDKILRLHDLPGQPTFETFDLHDHNPVSGRYKRRVVYNPNNAMRILQRRFLSWLRGHRVPLPNATGSRTGFSPVRNVRRHRQNRYFHLLDIRSAYKQVNGMQLSRILCELDQRLTGQEEMTLEFLTKYFMENETGSLITGGPASPELYNHYAGILLDRPLQNLCTQHGLTYTRYIDDITISSPTTPIGKRKRRVIQKLIESVGFPLNRNKTQACDLKIHPIVVTGVGLQWGGRMFLPRRYLRRLRGLLYRALHQGDISAAKINGMMGVFWAVTTEYGMNATEKKLAKQYRDTKLALQF